MNVFGVTEVPFTNSHTDIDLAWDTLDFGNEAIDEERRFFSLGIGERYLLIKLSRRDEFNQLICACPFTSVRDLSIRLSFAYPEESLVGNKLNQLNSKVPVIHNDMRETDTFG